MDALGCSRTDYGTSLQVTEQVRVELAAGRTGGHAGLEAVEDALSAGAISEAGPMATAERELFAELLRTLGTGEASCIALGVGRDGVVVTDDRTARRCCAGRGIPVTGTIRHPPGVMRRPHRFRRGSRRAARPDGGDRFLFADPPSQRPDLLI